MTRSIILPIAAVACIALMATALLLLRMIQRQERQAQRIAQVCGHVEAASWSNGESAHLRLLRHIGRFCASSGILPPKTLAEIALTLSAAGFRQESALSVFIGAKLVTVTTLPSVTLLLLHWLPRITVSPLIAGAVAAIAGLLLPDLIISRLRKKRLARTELGLPDALDMLIICTEAGLGLEAGLERVCVEIESAHPDISAELMVTVSELRISSDRSGALKGIGERTGLEPLKRLGVTLIQTMQYGTPLSEALRVLSTELRHEFLMRFETRAARLPVLMTLPMILFILPCVFIVVGGPSALNVYHTLTGH